MVRDYITDRYPKLPLMDSWIYYSLVISQVDRKCKIEVNSGNNTCNIEYSSLNSLVILIILSYYIKIYIILNVSIIDRIQPVFSDFNSTHGSLKQLNKLTFLYYTIRSRDKVNIGGPKLMVRFVLMPSISLFSL